MDKTIRHSEVETIVLPFDQEYNISIALFLLPTLLGTVLSGWLNYYKIPYQLVAITTGGIFGALGFFFPIFNQPKNFWDPSIISMFVMPVMILKLIYCIDTYLWLKSMSQILLISTVGVMFFTVTFGFILLVITNKEISLVNIAITGMLFVPNDVPDTILELEGIRNLEIVMDGESIFGTAFCLMTFEICLGFFDHNVSEWYHVVSILIRFIAVSIGVGFIFGVSMGYVIRKLYDDSFNATTAIIASCYFVYIFCDLLLSTNPVIALFIMVFYIAKERRRLALNVDTAIQNFLNICYFTIEVVTTVALSNFITLRTLQDFHYLDIVISIAVYIVGNCFRLLSFLILSPILSRIGYGINFTTIVTIFWAAKKGPMMILQAIILSHLSIIRIIGSSLLCFTICYVFLTIAVNGTTLNFILRKFGLIKFSITRKNNIDNGLKVLHDKRSRLISMMKMNRYFSDANWPLIQISTKFSNLYQESSANVDDEEDVIGFKRQTFCPNCSKNVPVEPTKGDLIEMTRVTSIRVLKSLRVSFVMQYEQGLVNKDELRFLQVILDEALDTEELRLQLDILFRIFQDRKVVERVKHIMQVFKMDDNISVPRNRFKRYCYILYQSTAYEIFICTTIAMNAIYVISEMAIANSILDMKVGFLINIGLTILYTAEFALKIVGYSAFGTKSAFKFFFGTRWNWMDFIALCLNYFNLFCFIYAFLVLPIGKNVQIAYQFVCMFRIFRFGQIIKLFGKSGPKLITYAEIHVDEQVSFAYTLAKALIVAYEDVVEQLYQLTDNEKIRDLIRNRLEFDKLSITRELGFIEKERPWITVTIKTKQIVKATLTYMKTSIFQLKSAGFVDNYEFQTLSKEVDNCFKVVKDLPIMEPNTPLGIFYEIPWLCLEDAVSHFLYGNVTTKIWNAGDIICEKDEQIEGIFIVVTGMFQMNYIPCDLYLQHMADWGAIPIRDFMGNARFTDAQEQYIMKANSFGELSVLTGRPHNCKIIAATPSQAFIIPCELIAEALQINQDPIYGLTSKMWKYVALNMARRILMQTPTYQSTSYNNINLILNRSFVPNLDHYTVFVLSEWIEDVVLIDGLIVDDITREIFTAPCYVPRSIQRIMLPDVQNKAVHPHLVIPRLLVIPVKGVDAYDVMQQSQEKSEKDDQFVDLYSKYKTQTFRRNKQHMMGVKNKIERVTASRSTNLYQHRESTRENSSSEQAYGTSTMDNSMSMTSAKSRDEYVKEEYLKQLDVMAPEYPVEEYKSLLDQNGSVSRIIIRITPPGSDATDCNIKYCPETKRENWQMICTIEELSSISYKDCSVQIFRKNGIPFDLIFTSENILHSFISVLDGYYRLTSNWTFNLCKDVYSPSLQRLYNMKCHGPVGGEFSYAKLEQKRANKPGSFILRESESKYNVYFIDVCMKDSLKPKTYKLERLPGDEFIFNDDLTKYSSVRQLMASYNDPDGAIYLAECVPPSEYDKSHLLLCQHSNISGDALSTATEDLNIPAFPVCINTKDLQVYKVHRKEGFNGLTVVYKGMWRHIKGKKIEVAMKILKTENKDKYFKDFIELAGQWAFLQSNVIVRLFGVTLTSQLSMVLEYLRLGPLDQYLRSRKSDMKEADLLEASLNLAQALFHLTDNGIVHGNIRCRKLMVSYHDDSKFVVKLGDPGMQTEYESKEVHWIPIECYANLSFARRSIAADVWAFATTLHEIFTYGETIKCIDHNEVMRSYIGQKRLPKPNACPSDIYNLMLECWDVDPYIRKRPQAINRDINQIVLQVNPRKRHAYATIKSLQARSLESVYSNQTETTNIPNQEELIPPALAMGDDDFSSSSQWSGNSTKTWSQTLSTSDDYDFFNMSTAATSLETIQSVFELDADCNVVLQGRIGQGFYGEVYKGTLEHIGDMDIEPQLVAVKKLKHSAVASCMQDFEREISIMRKLKHPNIVQILGVLRETEILLVMEFVQHGSLQSYLKIYKDSLTVRQLLKYAMDIAKGMHYLGLENIVHRDLAARNILVVDENHVKISDFGLAQVGDTNNYYFLKTDRELPIKWYALESLRDGKFSFKSDVWSYGVTMFEMFSHGEEPNLLSAGKAVGPEQQIIIAALESGIRCPCPTNCPQSVYVRIIHPCWLEDPHDRPKFAQLCEEIDDLLTQY